MGFEKKVLVSGDVCGAFNALFKRVAAVNKANGPFDALFCVGRLFPEEGGGGGEAGAGASELLPFLRGEKEVPVRTWLLGGFGQGADEVLRAVEEGPGRVQYLGRAGVQVVEGLCVAYLDGAWDAERYRDPLGAGNGAAPSTCPHIREAEVRELEGALEGAAQDVDLLLTCCWPAGVLPPGDEAATFPPGGAERPLAGSPAVADLARKARPRYHFAGGSVHYTRAPYMNRGQGPGGAIATRFIALARVGNPGKQRALHALNLAPAAHMPLAALTARPQGATESPYEGPAAGRKRPAEAPLDDTQSWRWQQGRRAGGHPEPSRGRPGVVRDERKTVFARNLPFRATEADLEAFFAQAGPVVDVRRGAGPDGKLHAYAFVQLGSQEAAARAAALSGAELQGRPVGVELATARGGSGGGAAKEGQQAGKPVEGCWFCLSSPDVDTDLIASIGEEVYCVLDKGPLVEGHALVLPIEHVPHTLALPPEAHTELERYLAALRRLHASQGKATLVFERYLTFRKMGGNHCQLNVVPLAKARAAGAAAALLRVGQEQGVPLAPLPGPAQGEAGRAVLRDAVGDGEFFVATLPSGERLVQAVTRGDRHPLNFGRLAAATLAGCPETADWKAAAEKVAGAKGQRVEAFKRAFASFDPMQQG